MLPRASCLRCGTEILDLSAERCAACGSGDRAVFVEETAKVREAVQLTGRQPGYRGARSGRSRGSVVLKLFKGDQQSADGSWVCKESLFDRQNNRRRELVVREDGTVLVDVDHPLSEHTGHGSAKNRA